MVWNGEDFLELPNKHDFASSDYVCKLLSILHVYNTFSEALIFILTTLFARVIVLFFSGRDSKFRIIFLLFYHTMYNDGQWFGYRCLFIAGEYLKI